MSDFIKLTNLSFGCPDVIRGQHEGRLHLLTPGVGQDIHVLGGPPEDGDDLVVGGRHDDHGEQKYHHHLVGGDHNTEYWQPN